MSFFKQFKFSLLEGNLEDTDSPSQKQIPWLKISWSVRKEPYPKVAQQLYWVFFSSLIGNWYFSSGTKYCITCVWRNDCRTFATIDHLLLPFLALTLKSPNSRMLGCVNRMHQSEWLSPELVFASAFCTMPLQSALHTMNIRSRKGENASWCQFYGLIRV